MRNIARTSKQFILFWVTILITASYAAAQHHTRLIVTCGNSYTFPFDPLTNRYCSGSLLAAASFAEQWKKELGANNVYWVDIPLRKLPLGEAVYHHLGDSTLRQRVMQHGGCLTGPSGDSLLTRFRVEQTAVDSLDDTEWLIVDRYEVGGETATQAKRYDNRRGAAGESLLCRTRDTTRHNHYHTGLFFRSVDLCGAVPSVSVRDSAQGGHIALCPARHGCCVTGR